jgi:ribulose-5-phosphate 4-epimerase/fuculose-1-phosphate aldolase
MYFGGLGYHDYEGPAVDLDEQRRLVGDLGPHEAMILRNHGLLSVGRTIAEAFVTMYWLDRACQAQALAMASNTELNLPGRKTVETTNARYKPGQRRKIGELEWSGLLRLVERRYPGFRD